MLKITNAQLLMSIPALQVLYPMNKPAVTVFAFQKVKRVVETAISDYNSTRDALLDQYGEHEDVYVQEGTVPVPPRRLKTEKLKQTGPNGKETEVESVVMTDENRALFTKETHALIEAEIELDLKRITPSALGSAEIPQEVGEMLDWLIGE